MFYFMYFLMYYKHLQADSIVQSDVETKLMSLEHLVSHSRTNQAQPHLAF